MPATEERTMKDFPIPVRTIGPGSQPEEEEHRADRKRCENANRP